MTLLQQTAEERATLRKVWRRLLPLLLLLYVVSWIDRVNVGFAALQMNHALGFSAAVYGLGAGLFFVGYSVFEIPSNAILARLGARRWIARIMVTWGIASVAMAFVRSAHGYYWLRFLLGVAEAGFFPGIIYYIGTWFPADARAKAMASFTLAMPLASAIGGPLAGLLLGLDGKLGLGGWQWLFVAEGTPAVLLGVLVLWCLPDSPAHAKWLTPSAREALTARLAREWSEQHPDRASDWREMLSNRFVWLLALSFFLASIGSYGLQFWLPEILKSVPGRSDLVVGMLSAIPYLPAALAMTLLARHSDRTGERVWHAAVPCLVSGLAFCVAAYTVSPMWSLVALSVAAAGVYGRHGSFWTLPPRFLGGRTAATGIALITSVGSTGGFVSPYVVGRIRDATGSYAGALVFLGAAMLLSGVLLLPMATRLPAPRPQPEP
jgi:ACS family tartrate transporter-like MFS transporter